MSLVFKCQKKVENAAPYPKSQFPKAHIVYLLSIPDNSGKHKDIQLAIREDEKQ